MAAQMGLASVPGLTFAVTRLFDCDACPGSKALVHVGLAVLGADGAVHLGARIRDRQAYAG